MEEIKEGMYVRLDTGRIGKVIHVKEKDNYPYSYVRIVIDTERYSRTTRNIIKASYDITDLIEVGDYVNGSKVIEIGEDIDDYGNNFQTIKVECDDMINYYIESIESIVTKEQFESMSYKVGEWYVKDKR